MRFNLISLLLVVAASIVSGRVLLVGSQTPGQNPVGLSVFKSNDRTGQVVPEFQVGGNITGLQPTYMALSKNKRYLYLTNEIGVGTVTAFKVNRRYNPKNPPVELKPLGSVQTNSSGPVHLVLTPKFAVVASYDDGSVTILEIRRDGRLGSIVDQVRFTGASMVFPDRQEGPHAHCVAISPCNRYVFVTDLGNDKIMQFKFNPQTGKLKPNTPAFISTGPGSLPRHLALHPYGHYVYLTNEYANTLVKYELSPESGTLSLLTSVKTTQKTGEQYAGAVHVTCDGRFVLVSNRGLNTNENSIAVFHASNLTYVSSGALRAGAYPRDFTVTRDNFVYVGNQLTNDLSAFRLLKNGTLVSLPLNVSIVRPVVLLSL